LATLAVSQTQAHRKYLCKIVKVELSAGRQRHRLLCKKANKTKTQEPQSLSQSQSQSQSPFKVEVEVEAEAESERQRQQWRWRCRRNRRCRHAVCQRQHATTATTM